MSVYYYYYYYYNYNTLAPSNARGEEVVLCVAGFIARLESRGRST